MTHTKPAPRKTGEQIETVQLPKWRTTARVIVTCEDETKTHTRTYFVFAPCAEVAIAIGQAKIMSNLGIATDYFLYGTSIQAETSPA